MSLLKKEALRAGQSVKVTKKKTNEFFFGILCDSLFVENKSEFNIYQVIPYGDQKYIWIPETEYLIEID